MVSDCGKQSGSPLKCSTQSYHMTCKATPITQGILGISWYTYTWVDHPREMKTRPHKNLYTDVQRSIICNVETTQMSIS